MKGIAVTACLSLLVLGSPPKTTYKGNQLWRITTDGEAALQLLQTLQNDNYLTLWGRNATKIDAMINVGFLETVKEKLRESHLEYEVSIEDLQKVIDEENPKPGEDFGRKGYRLTWEYYHSLGDIYDYLQYLEVTFPQLCTVRTIGRSVEGRPIKLLRVSNKNRRNKAVFIEGGIHAREWISPSAVTYIMHRIVGNHDKEPEYIRNLDWYFVPVLNPDGYVYSYNVERLWRKNRARSTNNCTGVDLNRNWGYDWGKNGSSSDPCSNSYRGKRPFSEPETASVANFFNNNPDVKWIGYIAIHSYGQYILYPWGSPNAILQDHDDLNRIGVEAATNIVTAGGESYSVGPAGITVYNAAGISMDWAKGAQAVRYAFTIELRDKGNYGYILPAKYIKATAEEAEIAVRTIIKSANS